MIGGLAVVVPRLGTTTYESTATSTIDVVIEAEIEETYPEDVLQDALEAQKRVLRVFDLEQDRTHILEEMEAKKAEYELYVKEQSEAVDSIDKELKTY